MYLELKEVRDKALKRGTYHRIADSFRKKLEKQQEEINSTLKKKVCVYCTVLLLLLTLGFGVGWFFSSIYHAPPSEGKLTSLDGTECLTEGALTVGGSCRTFYECKHGRKVPGECPKYHQFDPTTSSCRWIHLVMCASDHGDETAQTDTDNPTDDVDEEDDSDEVVVGVPTLDQLAEAEMKEVTKHGIGPIKRDLRTLSNREVEEIRPGSGLNPDNVKNLESVFSEQNWNVMFPIRNPSYTYRGLLQAVGKFPVFCDDLDLCPLSLAIIFAHFTQETGAHDSSSQYPEWRQGLYFIEEVGCTTRDCGYSSNCNQDTWLTEAWPCQKAENGKFLDYHGRGAKQVSYNYNYGQFSTFMYADPLPLLKNPELLTNSWLALASAIWFFVMPQPPKPSMLEVVSGSWEPNQIDKKSGLVPGFGVTTNIINGAIECGKGEEVAQSKNRQDYFRHFAKQLGLRAWRTGGGCANMKPFKKGGVASRPLFWEQDWSAKYKCKLVSYFTKFSALVPGDYRRCVEEKFSVQIST